MSKLTSEEKVLLFKVINIVKDQPIGHDKKVRQELNAILEKLGICPNCGLQSELNDFDGNGCIRC